MSYHIYTTEGIILKRAVFGEANILLHILTKDLGLIVASAQGARLSKSKLKGSLQEYSLVSVSLVKGKNGWKITNAHLLKNFFFEAENKAHKFFSKISKILLKMIVGESKHQEIFDITQKSFELLLELEESDIGYLEILSVLNILYELGYVAKEERIEKFIGLDVFKKEVLKISNETKIYIVSTINKALKESHL